MFSVLAVIKTSACWQFQIKISQCVDLLVSSKLPPLRNGDFKQVVAPTNSKPQFLLDLMTISSIYLPSLNITNLIPIPAFIHYPFFLQELSQISSTSPLTHCPNISPSMGQLYATGFPELFLNITSWRHLQWCHMSSLKFTIVGLFTPYGNWRLITTTNPRCFWFCFWFPELVVKHLLTHFCPWDWLQSSLTMEIVFKNRSLVLDKLELKFWLICLEFMWHWASYFTL